MTVDTYTFADKKQGQLAMKMAHAIGSHCIDYDNSKTNDYFFHDGR
jgi:hypothetical protein